MRNTGARFSIKLPLYTCAANIRVCRTVKLLLRQNLSCNAFQSIDPPNLSMHELQRLRYIDYMGHLWQCPYIKNCLEIDTENNADKLVIMHRHSETHSSKKQEVDYLQLSTHVFSMLSIISSRSLWNKCFPPYST